MYIAIRCEEKQMFEFNFCVSLEVVHPSIDPKTITQRIKGVRVTNETMAGSERHTRDGRPIEPRRRAMLTHWGAELHDGPRLYSGNVDLAEFVNGELDKLQQYREFFREVSLEGEVFLRIGWFSESNHSAARLSSNLLKRCGDIGLGMELDYYAPG